MGFEKVTRTYTSAVNNTFTIALDMVKVIYIVKK